MLQILFMDVFIQTSACGTLYKLLFKFRRNEIFQQNFKVNISINFHIKFSIINSIWSQLKRKSLEIETRLPLLVQLVDSENGQGAGKDRKLLYQNHLG